MAENTENVRQKVTGIGLVIDRLTLVMVCVLLLVIVTPLLTLMSLYRYTKNGDLFLSFRLEFQEVPPILNQIKNTWKGV